MGKSHKVDDGVVSPWIAEGCRCNSNRKVNHGKTSDVLGSKVIVGNVRVTLSQPQHTQPSTGGYLSMDPVNPPSTVPFYQQCPIQPHPLPHLPASMQSSIPLLMLTKNAPRRTLPPIRYSPRFKPAIIPMPSSPSFENKFPPLPDPRMPMTGSQSGSSQLSTSSTGFLVPLAKVSAL